MARDGGRTMIGRGITAMAALLLAISGAACAQPAPEPNADTSTRPAPAATTGPARTTAAVPATTAAPADPERPQPVLTLENQHLALSALMTRMQAGGLILLIRHERTEVPSRFDDYSRPLSDCMAQRNLSVAGQAGARESGQQLIILEVPIGTVLSSELCRAAETARLMFGRVTIEPRLLHHDNNATRTVTVSGTELVDLLRTQPLDRTNTAMVSHIGNIFFGIGLRLSEGEIAVIERSASGDLTILGTMIPSELGALSRQALMEREEAAAEAAAAATEPRRRR
jgi:phosphohistidine phosphatase SixA